MIGMSVQYRHIPVLMLLIPKFAIYRLLLSKGNQSEPTKKQELMPIYKKMLQEMPRGLLARVEVNHWIITLRNL